MDRNPFICGRSGGNVYAHCSAEDRIHAVKEFNRQQCEDAIKYVSDLQSTVQATINRRMKQLAKLGQ